MKDHACCIPVDKKMLFWAGGGGGGGWGTGSIHDGRGHLKELHTNVLRTPKIHEPEIVQPKNSGIKISYSKIFKT